MSRRTRRRYYRRHGRWSSRITNFTGSQSATSGNQFVIYQNLTTNPAQSEDSVSLKYTVKNINCQLQLESEGTASVENLQAYVMYIPQGFIPTGVPGAYSEVPFQHPEWIMAHRFIGSAQYDATNIAVQPGFPALRLRSRLARKLDTGDRIVIIILGNNTATSSVTLNYQGLVKYNTKAN